MAYWFTRIHTTQSQHHKNQIFEEMKETEKIIDQIEKWSRADGTDHASVVIMADTTHDEDETSLYCYGDIKDFARLVTYWMKADKETGKAIYIAACLYAHKHIAAEERDKINDTIREAACRKA